MTGVAVTEALGESLFPQPGDHPSDLTCQVLLPHRSTELLCAWDVESVPKGELECTFSFAEHALLLESLPQCNQFWIIDHQHSNRHTTDLCRRLELRAVPYEMFRPVICSRMEEANNLAGIWIEPRNVGPFGAIAVDASEGHHVAER